MQKREILLKIYHCLFDFFGPLNWWPGDTPFEIMVGAILTQNTAWGNVEKAINNLKRANLLEAQKLYQIEEEELAELIRPSGYYKVKAQRLKNLVTFLVEEYGGSERKMFAEDGEELREKLLAIKGIGPETADSILLYAGNKPFFVVDAYTRRIFSRHQLIPEAATYSEIQDFFTQNLDREVKLFNEFHAQIVMLGKTICTSKKENCTSCPLAFLNSK